MIEIKNISKSFVDGEERLTVLDNYSVVIPNGMTVILGESGCGKTTLLNIMGGLLEPDEGKVIVNGVSYYDLKTRERDRYRQEHFGYVFQDFYLMEDMSVVDNLLLTMAEIKGNSAEKTAWAEQALKTVGIEDKIGKNIRHLSGGERQRIAIARAIANNHDTIFCDEPTGSLDRGTSQKIMDVLKGLATGERAVIVVTHNEEFLKIADFSIDFRQKNESDAGDDGK